MLACAIVFLYRKNYQSFAKINTMNFNYSYAVHLRGYATLNFLKKNNCTCRNFSRYFYSMRNIHKYTLLFTSS